MLSEFDSPHGDVCPDGNRADGSDEDDLCAACRVKYARLETYFRAPPRKENE